MKINLKVRFKNPTFLLTFLPTAVAFVYSVIELFGIVPTVDKEKIVTLIATVVTALASIGILVDPTTKGISDSESALMYNRPKESIKI